MEKSIFSDSDTDFPSDLLFDIEAKFDSIINSIEKLLTGGDIVRQDSLKDIKVKCEMHMKCVKQISHLEMVRKCKHEYITDMIDTHAEKSQMITYCIFCETMKP